MQLRADKKKDVKIKRTRRRTSRSSGGHCDHRRSAGKTTAAQVVLPQQLDIREFVNADEIARGLSPFNPEGAALAAGRLMIERIRKDRRSFALETTNTAELPCSRMLARPARDLYLPLADLALIYDNSDEGRALIAERTPGDSLVIHDARRGR